ncbi:hypothetical protein V525_09315 [Gordonia alkanivorans CGMCC 6845]|uniref:AMP-dependent synthetase and ligase n=1 Tax=Gordonia alkanivorans CGMCC 6845 TaxID=1423140 RepID=W9DKX0_9ACTN|nr:hypothetical protein V525_09315 [Gordonia alkanivorans CGMCC 6845]
MASDPQRTAVIDDRGATLTRQDLADASSALADEMHEQGLRVGDVMIICLPNWTEWMVTYVAALRCGLVPGTLPVTTDPESIAYVANMVGAKAVALPRAHRGRDFAAEADIISRSVGRRIRFLFCEQDESPTWALADGAPETAPAYPAGLAHILFSSSTTGKSKAIAHSESSMDAYNNWIIDRYGITGEEAIFMPSPLGHSTGFWHGARMSLLTGASLVLQDHWDVHTALSLVEAHPCSITVAATPFLKDLTDAEWTGDTPKLAGLKTFVCGGAPIPPSLIERATTELPDTHIASIWAMSEGGATSSLPGDSAELIAETCGRVMPGVELETISESGVVNPRGVEGEIVMRTPSLFLGYLNQEDLYRESFTREGYFRTGDLGVVDHDGYLRLTGRLKDLIIRGGVNISPVDIENALIQHPLIAKVAVVGRPDDRLGERICAVIEPRPGSDLTFVDLVDWLRAESVPRRLWPESIHLVDAMPQTPAGKIRKNDLRKSLFPTS